MKESRRRYIIAILFAGAFVLSLGLLLWVKPYKEIIFIRDDSPMIVEEPQQSFKEYSPSLVWIPFITCVITAIGTFSAIFLAWRADKRNAIEQALKIAKLEHELEEIKKASKPESVS